MYLHVFVHVTSLSPCIPVCVKLSRLMFPGDLITYKAIMLSLFFCAFCLRQKLRKIKG